MTLISTCFATLYAPKVNVTSNVPTVFTGFALYIIRTFSAVVPLALARF